MLADEALELANQLGATAQLELGLDPSLEREQPPLLEPLRLDADCPLRLEIGERPPTPQAERLAETIARRGGIARGGGHPALLEQRLEALEVEFAGVDTDPVAGRAALDPVATEQRPQP